MPRKNKKEELKTWLSELKAFSFEIIYSTYIVNCIIVSDKEENAMSIAQKEFPAAIDHKLIKPFNRILS